MAKKKASKGMDTAGPVAPEKKMDGSDEDWEALSAYDALERAHRHMGDEGMMGRVRKIAGRKAKAAQGFNDFLSKGASTKPKVESAADLKRMAKAMREKAKEL